VRRRVRIAKQVGARRARVRARFGLFAQRARRAIAKVARCGGRRGQCGSLVLEHIGRQLLHELAQEEIPWDGCRVAALGRCGGRLAQRAADRARLGVDHLGQAVDAKRVAARENVRPPRAEIEGLEANRTCQLIVQRFEYRARRVLGLRCHGADGAYRQHVGSAQCCNGELK
jgi:hypothetical protein